MSNLRPALVGVIAVQTLERTIRRMASHASAPDEELCQLLDSVQVLRRALQPHQRDAMANLAEAADRAYRRQHHIPEVVADIAQELGRDLLYTLSLTSPGIPY